MATVTGLTNGTTYVFKVYASDTAGDGPLSTASNAVTPAPQLPGAPTIGGATGGNGQATVTFGSPSTNGGAPITVYTATSNPGGFVGTASTPLWITVTGLTNGTAYTFTVTATNSVGTGASSGASNSVTPATVPGAPTIGMASVLINGGATITFTAPSTNGGAPITVYTATSNPGGIIGTATGSPITMPGLTGGTGYTFTVTATNGAGTGAASAASNSIIACVDTTSDFYNCGTCGTVCTENGKETCASSECVPDDLWTQWPVPPDAPPDSDYSVSNGTVSDSVTGLIWQQGVPTNPCPLDGTGTCTWPDAKTYCQSLNGTGLGRYTSGWRLPEVVELMSIVNRNETDTGAAINPTAFPSTPATEFWANTPFQRRTGYAWTVNFVQGSMGESVTVVVNGAPASTSSVRCVRSPSGIVPPSGTPLPQVSAPPGRYVISNGGTVNGTVYDVVTQLTWQGSGGMTAWWSSTNASGSAQAYCASLDNPGLGGYTDWRLPTANELLSIVNFNGQGNPIDWTAFWDLGSDPFWTGTPDTYDNPGNVWTVNFGDGSSIPSSAGAGIASDVRCVR